MIIVSTIAGSQLISNIVLQASLGEAGGGGSLDDKSTLGVSHIAEHKTPPTEVT